MSRIRKIRLAFYGVVALSTSNMLARQLPVAAEALPDAATVITGPVVNAPTLIKLPGEMMPNPPNVSCQGSQLTIAADNSTLSSILDAVRSCIGIQFEIPNGSGSERVYFRQGPGPARQVLDALLSSTEFSYVIQSSRTSPDRVQAILLMVRSQDLGDAKDSRGQAISPNLVITPARKAWLAARNANGSHSISPEVEDLAPVEGQPASPGIAENATAVPAESSASAAGTDSRDSSAPLREGENSTKAGTTLSNATPGSDSLTPAASGDPAKDVPSAQLNNQIHDMQQLFEQRKNMTANPGTTPK